MVIYKDMYDETTQRIDTVVMSNKIPQEIRANHKGFSEWNPEITSKNHQPIVQILIDGNDQKAVDSEGNVLPTLVYMARDKRPQHQHNFKAGAMNALIRVSSVISNSPVIMNVDCDMYSNNSDTVREALCFFLDKEMGHKIGFVQYPQNYNNMTKDNMKKKTPSMSSMRLRWVVWTVWVDLCMLALDVFTEGRSFAAGGSPKTIRKTGTEGSRA